MNGNSSLRFGRITSLKASTANISKYKLHKNTGTCIYYIFVVNKGMNASFAIEIYVHLFLCDNQVLCDIEQVLKRSY